MRGAVSSAKAEAAGVLKSLARKDQIGAEPLGIFSATCMQTASILAISKVSPVSTLSILPHE
jgi:hypothetical protein